MDKVTEEKVIRMHIANVRKVIMDLAWDDLDLGGIDIREMGSIKRNKLAGALLSLAWLEKFFKIE